MRKPREGGVGCESLGAANTAGCESLGKSPRRVGGVGCESLGAANMSGATASAKIPGARASGGSGCNRGRTHSDSLARPGGFQGVQGFSGVAGEGNAAHFFAGGCGRDKTLQG